MNIKPYALAAGLLASAVGIELHSQNPSRTYDTIGMTSYIQQVVTQDRDFFVYRMNVISDPEIINKTHTKLINPEDEDEPVIFDQSGYGEVFGCQYLSLAHVVNKTKITVPYFTPFGVRRRAELLDRSRVIEELTFIDDIALESIVEDSETDVAVFNLPDELKHYCNDLTLDDLLPSSEVYVGMKVFWNGAPGGMNDVYRESIISQHFNINDEGGPYEHTYMLNAPVVPGSSAKYLWTLIDGEYKIVGLIQGVYNGLGIVKSIDDFLPYLDLKTDEVK